ncbi:uncharacterized protein LOC129598079 [Paramacrobiotus metropolitanus]|uniref:uncharacterized protein LOC129598079 n=1 Tax=Paramacrobiotus metropolitanus TaxID=2943436 RepID=UPI0024461064|nr:uncharacterized protein LOC129598079 [Paramacrobiotus metropolitanus]
MGAWKTCLFVLQMQLHLSAECPPPPLRSPSANLGYRKAGPDLNDMLAEVMLNSRQDDRIVLAQLAPSDAVTDSMVYRPRLGEDAAFRCEVPAGSDGREVSWLHQDRTIFEAGLPVPLTVADTTGPTYNFSRVHNTLILLVLNISMGSGGSVRCVATSSGPAYMSRPRVLQHYMLLPLITRRSDVFAEPEVSYVTATEGESVTVPCNIRLPLPEGIFANMRNHVIWRHNDRVVYGPSEAPYGFLISNTGIPQAIEIAHPNDTQPANRPGHLVSDAYNFPAVTLAAAGQVQCLFRPHQGIHEWIVQSTKLVVFAKKNAQ